MLAEKAESTEALAEKAETEERASVEVEATAVVAERKERVVDAVDWASLRHLGRGFYLASQLRHILPAW